MAKLMDLTGQKIDKLLVLEKAPSRARHVYWKCRCDCGNECEVSGEFLRRNILPRDCGCSKKKNIKQQEAEKRKNHLVGQKFGKLTVLNPLDDRKNNSIIWHCQCDCGNYKDVPTYLLTSGHTQSCGCLNREKRWNDLSGQKFGKLTALFPCDYKISSSIVWHCKCECGNEVDVQSYYLRNGDTQSCGCINYSIGEKNIETLLKNNNIIFKKEWTNKDLNKKRFDFAIYDQKQEKVIRLIEFDGIQHFQKRTGSWEKRDTLERRQYRDQLKNEYAKLHNIPLVRIPYWERDNITLDIILGDKYLI